MMDGGSICVAVLLEPKHVRSRMERPGVALEGPWFFAQISSFPAD